MKAKPVSAQQKSVEPKKNAGRDGNGRGPQPRASRPRREVLEGQPPIETLLGGAAPDSDGNGRDGNGRNGNGNGRGARGGRLASLRDADAGLDKTMLLTALIAFRKGDFSVRLPVDLEGI